MKRKFLRTSRILGMVLVLGGLGLVLTSCEMQPETIDIYVTNNSVGHVDVIFVRREAGRDSTHRINNVAPGATVNRHYTSGYYSVRVQLRHPQGNATFHHPMPAGQFRHMSGTVRLTFLGDRLN